jgi:hypothetical protein
MEKYTNGKNIFFCLAALLLLPVVAAIAIGAVWGVVDWLRAYGSGISPFPYFDHSVVQAEPFRRQAAGTLLGGIEDLINWYNLNFRGATRFGSGIGLIAGAFIALGLFKGKSTILRLCAGVLAGSLIGARSVLMLGSGAPLFLVGLLTGAVLGAGYMTLCAGPAKIGSLPSQQLP